MKAIWNGKIIAESHDTVVLEHNHYFPRSALKPEHFRDSNTHTTCYWKGKASYFHVLVDGETNEDAAWYYPSASEEAKVIEGRVAFWNGVQVTD